MLTEMGEQCHFQPLGKVGGGVIKLEQSGKLQLWPCSLHTSTKAHRQGGYQGPQGLNQQHRHHLVRVLENLQWEKGMGISARKHTRRSLSNSCLLMVPVGPRTTGNGLVGASWTGTERKVAEAQFQMERYFHRRPTCLLTQAYSVPGTVLSWSSVWTQMTPEILEG